jgi:hypothetical protein
VTFHLAQVNIGRLRAPMDDPIMDGFRSQLDPINALADRSPGFVWRLQTDEGNATSIRPYADDDRMAINLSVWESLDALQQFVYKPRTLVRCAIGSSGSNRSTSRFSRCGGFQPATYQRLPKRKSGCGC